MSEQAYRVFWFRRDIRLHDNHGLYQALQGDLPVIPLFIFDWNILDKLEDRNDKRVQFIHQEIQSLNKELAKHNSSLLVKYGKPENIWQELLKDYPIKSVYVNRDYEPYGQNRDKELYENLRKRDIEFKGYKDQVLFEKDEILKDDGDPYVVYTPYMKRYKAKLGGDKLPHYPSERHLDQCWNKQGLEIPTLAEMGFEYEEFEYPSREIDKEIIKNYHKTRDIPAIRGTSRLSLHLRFGTISVRHLANVAREVNDKYFNELIWRDFYQSILYHYPHSIERAFRPEYDEIEWENNEAHFQAWCAGKTGYPLVDAAMRELNTTGFMHNRMRMLTASFLTKHLLIDWRWGEAYFARKLLDYEAGSNVGGWQWAAGSGVDAAPYFRIFSPSRQQERFDKDYQYVKQYVAEYGTDEYPEPIVEHKAARERALDRYKATLKN